MNKKSNASLRPAPRGPWEALHGPYDLPEAAGPVRLHRRGDTLDIAFDGLVVVGAINEARLVTVIARVEAFGDPWLGDRRYRVQPRLIWRAEDVDSVRWDVRRWAEYGATFDDRDDAAAAARSLLHALAEEPVAWLVAVEQHYANGFAEALAMADTEGVA